MFCQCRWWGYFSRSSCQIIKKSKLKFLTWSIKKCFIIFWSQSTRNPYKCVLFRGFINLYYKKRWYILINLFLVFLLTAIFPTLLVIVAFFYEEERIDKSLLDADDRRNNTTQCIKDFWAFFKNPLIYK